MLLCGKEKKEEYRSRLNEITDQLVKFNDEDIECREQEKKLMKIFICGKQG